MTSHIDLESILAPISEEQPSGQDCRLDPSPLSAYQTVKSARNSARSIERNNVFGGGDQEADEHWRKVIDLCPGIFTSQSKDLEIASWYTEAMIRRYGFSGLRDAFAIIKGFIERYWDDLYPMPDEDGLETRVSPLAGLNGEGAEGVLLAPIRNAVITEGNNAGPFTYWEYQQAQEIHRVSDQESQDEMSKKLGFTLEDVNKAIAESSVEFLVQLREQLSDCINLYRAISQLVDERCGTNEAPPTSNIINTLEECERAVLHLGKDRFPMEDTPVEEDNEPSSDTDTTAAAQPKTAVGGPIASREQAFRQLKEIADFFRKTEPHSPVSYILEKSVKWGNMPLQELIQELIPDGSSREHYSMLTGVKTED